MQNLLQETLARLGRQHKTAKNVCWVGTIDGTEVLTFEEFAEMANFEYDNGFGAVEIRPDLVIVGDDWWLERGEYDGSEWWSYKEKPTHSKNPKKLDRLKSTPEEQPL